MAAGDFSRVEADALRAGRGRRPHARRQCRHPAGRRAGDPGARPSSSCSRITDVPLSIDSSIVAALEAGLAVYKGKALVNSVTGEEERLETRAAAGEEIRRRGRRHLQRRDRHLRGSGRALRGGQEDRRSAPPITAFPPATSSSIRWSCRSARSTRPACRSCTWCAGCASELKVNTTCGASNVSFGLPNRDGINAAFLTMAIGAGMTSAITNPLHAEIVQACMGADVMMGHDPDCARWIRKFREAAGAPARRRRGGAGARAPRAAAARAAIAGGATPSYAA